MEIVTNNIVHREVTKHEISKQWTKAVEDKDISGWMTQLVDRLIGRKDNRLLHTRIDNVLQRVNQQEITNQPTSNILRDNRQWLTVSINQTIVDIKQWITDSETFVVDIRQWKENHKLLTKVEQLSL